MKVAWCCEQLFFLHRGSRPHTTKEKSAYRPIVSPSLRDFATNEEAKGKAATKYAHLY
jgi:hypothetical protein